MMFWALTAAAMPLHKALDRALDDPALQGASLSIVVLDADGERLYARDPDRRLVPASTAKLVTAAAAVRERGLSFTFDTEVYATGTLSGDTLLGDVVVRGGGDPSLGDPDPRIPFDLVAHALREQGILHVQGDVVVEATPGPLLGKGWMWDDLRLPYSAPYGAANIGHNLQVPGLELCPAQDGPGSPLLDPATCLATALHAALPTLGLPVDGVARLGAAGDGTLVAVLHSAPADVLLRHLLVTSDNLYAECLGRGLDRDALLRDAGASTATLVDGSGLSRYSAISAADLAAVAWLAFADPAGVLALLPVSGRDGTLATRTLGTPAEGRVRAKTGSMTGVRNLVGAVDAVEERLVVAFLINGLAAPQAEAIAVQDRALSLLASARRGKVSRRTVDLLLPER